MSGDPFILLVEDNADHAELVRRSLAKRVPAVALTVVQDGEEALAFLFRHGAWADPASSPRPQLILLDLRLPKVDGLQVLERVKRAEALRHIPVVVLTTSEAASDMTQAYARHANSYLVKPGRPGGFAELMREVDEYWLSWNRQPPLPS